MKKCILKIIPIIFALLIVVTHWVFADGPISSSVSSSGGTISEIISPVYKIYGSIVFVVRILAFLVIIITGVKYMFTSADGKAEIKNQSINLVVGSIIVFGVATVVDVVVKISSEIF